MYHMMICDGSKSTDIEASYETCLVLACIALDLMHVADLGISQALVGNCLYEWFLSLGGLLSKPLSTLGDMLVIIGVASKHLGFDRPINELTLTMFKQSGKTPKMRTKAAETRRMVAVIDWIVLVMFKPTNPHEELRQRCVHQMALFYEELTKWGIDSPRRAATFGRQHVILYGELLREALASREWQDKTWHAWRFYPKHHLFVHLVEVAIPASGNPKSFWCYQDENAIGEAVEIGRACHCRNVHRSVIDKYRL